MLKTPKIQVGQNGKQTTQVDWQAIQEKRHIENTLKKHQKELRSFAIRERQKNIAFWASSTGELYRLQIDVLSRHHYMRWHWRYKEFEIKYWSILKDTNKCLEQINKLLKEAETMSYK
ncbi:hypothetical protein [Pseudolactococcus yaeyamensis]